MSHIVDRGMLCQHLVKVERKLEENTSQIEKKTLKMLTKYIIVLFWKQNQTPTNTSCYDTVRTRLPWPARLHGTCRSSDTGMV